MLGKHQRPPELCAGSITLPQWESQGRGMGGATPKKGKPAAEDKGPSESHLPLCSTPTHPAEYSIRLRTAGFSANQEKSLHHIKAPCICPGFMEINSEREGLKPRAKHIILTLWKHWKGSTEAKRKTVPRGTGKEAWPVIQKSILISLRSFLTGPCSSAIHRDCS